MKKIVSMLLALALIFMMSACTNQPTVAESETEIVETQVQTEPETIAETEAETKAKAKAKAVKPTEAATESEPETKAPETEAPETKAPETQAPETQAPETQAPETQAPETQAPQLVVDQNTCNHSWPDWTIVKNVTQTEDGLLTRTCLICGKVENQVQPKTPINDGDEDNHGLITASEFHAFDAYVQSQEGYTRLPLVPTFYSGDLPVTPYRYEHSGGYPYFEVTHPGDKSGEAYIIVWFEPSSSADEGIYGTVDELYSFFNRYK